MLFNLFSDFTSILSFYIQVTDKCSQKKGTGCYSFNVSQDVIDPMRVTKIELWVYKQVDKNDHHIQVPLNERLVTEVRY